MLPSHGEGRIMEGSRGVKKKMGVGLGVQSAEGWGCGLDGIRLSGAEWVGAAGGSVACGGWQAGAAASVEIGAEAWEGRELERKWERGWREIRKGRGGAVGGRSGGKGQRGGRRGWSWREKERRKVRHFGIWAGAGTRCVYGGRGD